MSTMDGTSGGVALAAAAWSFRVPKARRRFSMGDCARSNFSPFVVGATDPKIPFRHSRQQHQQQQQQQRRRASLCAFRGSSSQSLVARKSHSLARALSDQPWATLGGEGELSPVGATSNEKKMIEQIGSVLERRIDALLAAESKRSNPNDPAVVGRAVSSQLRQYVSRIAGLYRGVKYHSLEHATHVTLSLNKMIEMLRREDDDDEPPNPPEIGPKSFKRAKRASSLPDDEEMRVLGHREESSSLFPGRRSSSAFGIADDPLASLALVFSALVHDVDHTGIPNAQLVAESDPLAVYYEGKSVAEQNSIRIALSMLMEDEFEQLRSAVIPTGEREFAFRTILIDMLLCTDISDKERTARGKARFEEAFASAPTRADAPPPPASQTIPRDATTQRRRHSMDCRSVAEPHERPRHSRIARRNSLSSGLKHALDLRKTASVRPEPPAATTPGCRRENVELKRAAVMEQMMQASDVAHTLQSWENFVKWNGRLFHELHEAYLAGRGADPSSNWFRGQIGFYDFYVLPLARRLARCGAFGEKNGAVFLRLAEANKARWLLEGEAVTRELIDGVSSM